MLNIVLPKVVLAQTQNLIRDRVAPACDGRACKFKDLEILVQNVLDLLIGISIVVVIFVILYAGFSLLFHEKPEDRAKLKSLLKTSIIGLLLVLSAWFLFSVILNAIGAQINPLT